MGAKALVDKFVDDAENARMDAKRVADECAAVLGPVKRFNPRNNTQDPDLVGIKKATEDEEEKPTVEDNIRRVHDIADAELKGAIARGQDEARHLRAPRKWMKKEKKQEENGESGESGQEQKEQQGESGSEGQQEQEDKEPDCEKS